MIEMARTQKRTSIECMCVGDDESLQSADAASFQLLCHLAVVYFVDLKLFGVLCARMIYGDFM